MIQRQAVMSSNCIIASFLFLYDISIQKHQDGVDRGGHLKKEGSRGRYYTGCKLLPIHTWISSS